MKGIQSAQHDSGADDRIFGRELELAQLNELVDGVPENGAALLVRGDPGIGKTVLLKAAISRAVVASMRILRTTGVESEAELPFAGLHQLVMPILEQAEDLPLPQRTALLTAFGVAGEDAPDRFLIALAVLQLLSNASETAPLLLVVDDAQWLDQSSAGVLAFVARRIEHERVGMLIALREGVRSVLADVGLPELRLGGLNEDAAEALLAMHGKGLEPLARSRLLEEAEGNPLALVELPYAQRADLLDIGAPLPTPLHLTERLERAFAAKVAELPSTTRALLLIAAASDGGSLGEIMSATAALIDETPDEEDLTPAISARLTEIDDTRIIFRHPLVRSAVYHRATAVEQRAAHYSLADALTDEPDRQVWHRAAALGGADENIARGLERAAARARRRGAISVAVSALERAAQVSAVDTQRGQRFLDAAEVASELGRRELVLRLLGEAEQVGLDSLGRQRALLIQEAFDTGEDAVRIEQIITVTEKTWDRAPDFALNVLRRAAGKSWWVGRSEERRELLVAAVERMGVPEVDPQRLAILALVGSRKREEEVLRRLDRLVTTGVEDPVSARLLGLAGYAVGHFEFAVDALTVAIAGLRGHGQLALLAQAIVARTAASVHLGRIDLARTDADEGYRLSVETRQPLFADYARAAQALLAGLRGEIDVAETIAAEVEKTMIPLRGNATLWDVQLARGITALGAGRYDDAFQHLIRTFDSRDPAEHFRKKFWIVGDLAEAAVYSERHDQARDVVAEAEEVHKRASSPRTRIALEYARPLLADDDEAESLFEAGLSTDLTRWPLARARMLLAYGTWLRRQRRVVESRPYLNTAKDTFEALGAKPWSERARHELRAAGVMSQPHERSVIEGLTPQELQVARMAASGLTNREIGQQLYMSHRTVGAHLYRAFPKLGISSRGQLHEVLRSTLI
ncbi:MAG TPA: AAA family ATPase [Rubrobacter sp.]|nr:AAA family ATPase [Rubrobacter sp.]